MFDPDLEIRGGGGGGALIQSLRKAGAVSQKIFSALGASVWSKNYGGRAPQGPLLDPPLETTVFEG